MRGAAALPLRAPRRARAGARARPWARHRPPARRACAGSAREVAVGRAAAAAANICSGVVCACARAAPLGARAQRFVHLIDAAPQAARGRRAANRAKQPPLQLAAARRRRRRRRQRARRAQRRQRRSSRRRAVGFGRRHLLALALLAARLHPRLIKGGGGGRGETERDAGGGRGELYTVHCEKKNCQ